VTPKTPARALLALAVAGAALAAAQETPPGTPLPAPVIVAAGTGALAGSGGGDVPLPWVDTAEGTLVALSPVAGLLGGRLETGALGASYTLTVGDVVFVLAPGSPSLTRGTEILTLSRAPLERDGLLYVPIDFVAKSYGALVGAVASWDPVARRLTVGRPDLRELPVELSLVHVEGVTTVVLRPPETVRYRIVRGDDRLDVVPIGDRFLPAAPRTPADDPYLRDVRVASDRVRLELAPGVEADEYALRDPFRIVIDLFRPRAAPSAPLAAPPVPARGRGVRTVVIDPGHGGDETGAIGPAGTMEKDLTLAIARELAERLRATLGLQVVLTRGEDVAVALDERSALANQQKADLFLSVHLNATVAGRARGAETYFLSLQATDERAAGLAATENLTGGEPAPPGSEEFDLQLLLWDLAQSRHLASSQRLARFIQEELNRALELPDRGVKQAPFRVLTGAAMPAVLVELGFLSNAEEEKRLRDPVYRTGLAETLVRAVARFKAELEGAVAGAVP
jgi:N-acetylmuramoyl-L-alanine amidase